MKSSTSSMISLAGLVSSVAGHGFITSPQPRLAGDAMKAACGQQVYNNQASDNYGNIQGELQIAASQSDYDADACDIWLCKGYKFDDNTANVQSYTAGQTVDITVDIRAPHTGTANVSIVKTSSDTLIGSILKSWDVYASTATGVTSDETNFSITIPSDLGSECSTAGDCVIQWWWDARSIDQTYESCIDFTVGGSGSASGSVSSVAAVASSTAASSVAASSAAASSVAASSAAVTSIPPTSTPASSAAASSATPTPTTPVSVANNAATSTAVVLPSSSVIASATSAAAPAATHTASSSSFTLPEGFTLQQFITWLEEVNGKSSKEAHSVGRVHARAF